MGRGRLGKFVSTLLAAVILLAGCHGAGKPRMRFGAFFGSPTGMKFPDPTDLGTHNYKSVMRETNGMAYTCKGGFIDIGHVREAADRTAYLKKVTYQNLIGKKAEFPFRAIEPSEYWVKVSYPANWDGLSAQEKERIANEISIQLGQHFAHTTMVWHEILSWYGYATMVIFPDTISAFSWEDSYSDVLGTGLGAAALRDKEQPYNEAMTKLLYDTLKELDVQPSETAKKAAQWVERKWYKGGLYFFVDMKMHNFDVGLNDGRVTPWLVPEICPGAVPHDYPLPDMEMIGRYGFKVEVSMEPRVRKKHKIYESIGLDMNSRIIPEIHFPLLMKHIENSGEGEEQREEDQP